MTINLPSSQMRAMLTVMMMMLRVAHLEIVVFSDWIK
jgi:hypothetical protein